MRMPAASGAPMVMTSTRSIAAASKMVATPYSRPASQIEHGRDDDRNERGQDTQADGVVSPAADHSLPARQNGRHRRDRKRDQGGTIRLTQVHHQGQADHEQRHQHEHRHHGAHAEPRVAQQQKGIRGSRAQANGNNGEHDAGSKDEFDDSDRVHGAAPRAWLHGRGESADVTPFPLT